MAYTNFPKGFPTGVTLRGLPITQTHTGKTFWVSNASAAQLQGHASASNGNPGTFDKPFSTIEYALSQCVASRCDIIFVKPGHAESISSATALNFDTAGVAIIGLGTGSLRPTLTFDTATTATIPVTAANMSISNFIFNANFADIVSVFTLTTAADFAIEKCLVKQQAADLNFLHVIDTDTTTGNANGLYMDEVDWISIDAATLAMALVDGTNDGWVVKNCYFNLGGTTTAAIGFTCASGKVLTNAKILNNVGRKIGQTDGSAGVWLSSDATTHSGFIKGNLSENTDDAANILTVANSGLTYSNDNLHSGEQGEHGVVLTTVFNNA